MESRCCCDHVGVVIPLFACDLGQYPNECGLVVITTYYEYIFNKGFFGTISARTLYSVRSSETWE